MSVKLKSETVAVPHKLQAPLKVTVQTADFDVGAELDSMRQCSAKTGALVSFTGVMRDMNEGEDVSTMTLEHYPGMTEASIESSCNAAFKRWPLLCVRVIHRVGTLKPEDQIVFVGVSSMHRHAAFSACEFIMDFLKTEAPLWKKEVTAAGERWVEERDTDIAAKRRWQQS